jgi:hypothetical protein
MFEICIEWDDRRKRTKDFQVTCETFDDVHKWIDENRAIVNKSSVWIANKETNCAVELRDAYCLGIM